MVCPLGHRSLMFPLREPFQEILKLGQKFVAVHGLLAERGFKKETAALAQLAARRSQVVSSILTRRVFKKSWFMRGLSAQNIPMSWSQA